MTQSDDLLSIPAENIDMSALAQPPLKVLTEHQLLSALENALLQKHLITLSFDESGWEAHWVDPVTGLSNRLIGYPEFRLLIRALKERMES